MLDKLPRRLQRRAKRTMHEMMYAESRAECEAARARFAHENQAKYPKAVESLRANWSGSLPSLLFRPSIGSICAPPA